MTKPKPKTRSMEMIENICAFLDANADVLKPKQQELAAVFMLEYPGKRFVSMGLVIESFRAVGIRIVWKSGNAWHVYFEKRL